MKQTNKQRDLEFQIFFFHLYAVKVYYLYVRVRVKHAQVENTLARIN